MRHRFIRSIREWFDQRDFIEVETPYCVPSPGMEPHLRAFEVSTVETPVSYQHLYLHTSPEYHMKRLLATHQLPIYQLCRCFRDEPPSRLHHPEFTMLEWYRPHVSYQQLMRDCEGLISAVAQACLDTTRLDLPEGSVELDGGFERLSIQDAFLRHTAVDPLLHSQQAELLTAARNTGFDVPDHWSWEDIFHYLLIEAIEERLGHSRPTILFAYPACLAALSTIRDGVAERFELYLQGHELANAFQELVDPEEQRLRFLEDQRLRKELNRPVYPIDEGLLEALARCPQSAGIALGLDRLWLLFCEHLLGRRLALRDVLCLYL